MTQFLQKAIKMVKHFQGTPTKLVLIVRSDLKMSKGKTAAQCAHAAVLCVQEIHESNSQDNKELLRSWFMEGQPKIVLKVDGGYDELTQLQDQATRVGVVAALVQDAGRTQLAAGTATVLGIGPDKVERIDKLVGHLKLL